MVLYFCQAEDGIRYLVRSRGLGDVYKRQGLAGGRNPAQAGSHGIHAVNRRLVRLPPGPGLALSLIHI
mgnify:CR=1 FL=1